jgi:hypothetical protein
MAHHFEIILSLRLKLNARTPSTHTHTNEQQHLTFSYLKNDFAEA